MKHNNMKLKQSLNIDVVMKLYLFILTMIMTKSWAPWPVVRNIKANHVRYNTSFVRKQPEIIQSKALTLKKGLHKIQEGASNLIMFR